jgi:hypothetical protein
LPAVKDERGRVERGQVADGRDLLAVLVDQEHDVGVGVRREPLQRLLDPSKLLVVQDEVRECHE